MEKPIEKRFEILAEDTGLAIERIEGVLRELVKRAWADQALTEELDYIHNIALGMGEPDYPADIRFQTRPRR